MSAPRPRVAMFVLNPCHSDARVRKEAASLARAGYDVRVFALGNSLWPEALVDEGEFTIQRLEVRSAYQRIIALLARVLLRRREPTVAAPPPAVRRRRAVTAPVLRVAAVLLAPMALLGMGARAGWLQLQQAAPASTDHVRRAARWALRAARRSVRAGRRGVRRALRTVRRAARAAARRLYLALHRVVRRRLIVLHRPTVHLAFWTRAAGAAAAWAPDVVHAHDLNALPAATRVARRTGAPVVYDSHELWRHRNRVHGRHPIGRLGDAWQERRLIRRADKVITVAHSIGTWLEDTYDLPPGRVRIVRNVPWDRHNVPATDVSLRRDFGMEGRRIFLYTGRITTGRGIEEALAALPHLPDDVVLALLGYGEATYVESLFAIAAASGVRDRVVLVPPVPSEQVAAVAAEADAALVAVKPICLSYRYALPNKLFEAIQAGVPVVATALPEISRVVAEYRVGELYEPDDGGGLARSLLQVLGDPERYREGTRRAAIELCWERESAVLLETYAELAAARPSPALAKVS